MLQVRQPRAEAVLSALRAALPEPLDDDELAAATGINRHYVNAICRRLETDGTLSRARGATGKLINQLKGTSTPRPVPEQAPVVVSTSGRGRSRQRRDDRVTQLIAGFSGYVELFERAEAFPGPSLYFHMKAIERRREHGDVVSALADERLLELIYAVLPAWGMHRMGKQAAKVGDFATIVERLRTQRAALEQLWPLRITTLAPDDVAEAAQLAWQVISTARASTSATQIVAGSKFLHHLLPDLVPPIDRQYTFSFFTNQKMVSHGDRQAFLDWMPLFAEIGRSCHDEIRSVIERGGFMATGEAKVIDNAIMGFMQELRRESRHDTGATMGELSRRVRPPS
jgi:hypothetical protein